MTDISISRAKIASVEVEVRGITPLITNAWSEKSVQAMLAKHMGKAEPKTLKDPEANFQASRYKFNDRGGDGFPVLGFKKATVAGGGRMFKKSVKMTELRQMFDFKVDGYSTLGIPLVRLVAGEPMMRQDVTRNSTGVADIRHRAMYPEWGAILTVEYPLEVMDVGTVIALIDAGGRNGVGDWRPEKNGIFGQFEVVDGGKK
jgi:hypothetical protein